jgi:hypothetical protein
MCALIGGSAQAMPGGSFAYGTDRRRVAQLIAEWSMAAWSKHKSFHLVQRGGGYNYQGLHNYQQRGTICVTRLLI